MVSTGSEAIHSTPETPEGGGPVASDDLLSGVEEASDALAAVIGAAPDEKTRSEIVERAAERLRPAGVKLVDLDATRAIRRAVIVERMKRRHTTLISTRAL